MGVTHTIQSTASMRDRSLVGRPMASRMMAMVMMPPAGMPAAPTLEAVAVTLETMLITSLRQEGPAHGRAGRQLNSQDGEDLPAVQLDVVELSDEDGGDALEYGRAVHVHRGPDGEDEAADALVHAVVLLDALYHGGKRCGAGDRRRHSASSS